MTVSFATRIAESDTFCGTRSPFLLLFLFIFLRPGLRVAYTKCVNSIQSWPTGNKRKRKGTYVCDLWMGQSAVALTFHVLGPSSHKQHQRFKEIAVARLCQRRRDGRISISFIFVLFPHMIGP